MNETEIIVVSLLVAFMIWTSGTIRLALDRIERRSNELEAQLGKLKESLGDTLDTLWLALDQTKEVTNEVNDTVDDIQASLNDVKAIFDGLDQAIVHVDRSGTEVTLKGAIGRLIDHLATIEGELLEGDTSERMENLHELPRIREVCERLLEKM